MQIYERYIFSGQLGLESLIIVAKDVPIAKSRTKMISGPTGAGKSDFGGPKA